MASVVGKLGGAAEFPQAPSEDAWAAMTPAERARAVAALPAGMTEAELLPPEGDPHREIKIGVETTLREHFQRTGRSVYVAADLTVYYPGAPRFSPDILCVVDVDPKSRMKWVVSDEKRGLDVVLEVHVAGDRKKDLERNPELYARLGIPEYFVFDRGRRVLYGYRLPDAGARAYMRLVPQAGRLRCEKLGLDLVVEGDRVRFYVGTAMLLELPEIVARLERLTAEATARGETDARRAEDEARRAEDEARRADANVQRADHETQRANELARRVAELEAELARRR